MRGIIKSHRPFRLNVYTQLFVVFFSLAACKQQNEQQELPTPQDTLCYVSVGEFKHSYLVLPDSFVSTGDDENGVTHYKVALHHFQDKNNSEGSIASQIKLAEIYLKYALWDSVTYYCNNALKLYESKTQLNEHLLADIHHTLGSLNDRIGKGNLAIREHLKALEIRKRLSKDCLTDKIANSYYAIGDAYRYTLFNYFQAEQYYDSALNIRKHIFSKYTKDFINCYYNLASTNRWQGDFLNASELGKAAYNLAVSAPIVDSSYLAKCNNLRANIYYNMKQYDSSSFYYKQAMGIEQQLKHSDPSRLGTYYGNLARNYIENKQFNKALTYLEKTKQLTFKNNSNSIDKAQYYFQTGSLYYEKGDFTLSLTNLKEALRIRKEIYGNNHSEVYQCFSALGDLFEKFNRTDSALFYFQQALSTITTTNTVGRGCNYVETIKRDDYYNMFFGLKDKARVLIQRYHESNKNRKFIKAAYLCHQQGDVLIDSIRQAYERDGSKLLFAEDYQSFYENGLACLKLLFDDDPCDSYLNNALYFMEKNKAILLQERLGRMSRDTITSNPIPSYLAENNQFDYNGGWYNHIHEKLNGKKATNFIEFFYGKKYIFMVSAIEHKVSFKKTELSDALKSSIREYEYYLTKNPSIDHVKSELICYTENANYLFEQLVRPALGKIDKRIRFITIIPDGDLCRLPFEALITELPGNNVNDFSQLNYMLSQFDIGYAPSLNMLLSKKAELPKQEKNILAMGYTNPGHSSTVSQSIPGAMEELKVIESSMNSTVFSEQTATLQNFKANAHRFNILHLALHGKSNVENPDSSYLAFYANDDKQANLLLLKDLYQLKLNAELVVLSACETGVGKYHSGEGVYSIARGFFASGCTSTIVSLWKVNDRPTSKIMTYFYGELLHSNDSHIALSNAKRKYLNKDPIGAHPFNWAPMIYLGTH